MGQFLSVIFGLFLSVLGIAIFAYAAIFVFSNIGWALALLAVIVVALVAWHGFLYLLSLAASMFENREKYIKEFKETDLTTKLVFLSITGLLTASLIISLARQAHKANAELTQRMPLLQDALKGVEPDKLFQKHILGGNAAQLGETIEVLKNTNPQAVADIKQQTLLWISNKSVNQNGGFSPAGMKKALDSLGDRRLLTMFNANELSHIKDIAKAGDYLVTQPNHSYVNNSNTSAALMNFFGGLINKPGVRVLLSPLKDVADSVKVSRSLKGSVAGEAVPAATNPLISNTQLEIIDKLSKAGLIGGANASKD